MDNELLEMMGDPRYSANEAAQIVGIAPGRLQTWMNRGMFSFKTIEQGPRRLLRRFDGHDLIMLGTMVNLVDEYGIDVSDAKEIARHMQADASLLLLYLGSADPERKKDLKPIRPKYYTICDGEVDSCFGIDTIHEARERLGKDKKIFTVFDATPAIHKALLHVMQLIGKELEESLAEAATE